MEMVVPCLLHVLLNVPRKLFNRAIEEIDVLTDKEEKKRGWAILEKVVEKAKIKLYRGSAEKVPSFQDRWKKTRTNRNDIIHLIEAMDVSGLPAQLDELLPHPSVTVSLIFFKKILTLLAVCHTLGNLFPSFALPMSF